MSNISDALELLPKALTSAEQFFADPRSAMRRPFRASEALTLLACSLFTMSFAIVLTALTIFYRYYPTIFRNRIEHDLKEKLEALFTIAGSLIFAQFCLIVMMCVIITVIGRVLGGAKGQDVFAKTLVIFCLEVLAGVPIGIALFWEDVSVQTAALWSIAALRMVEALLIFLPLGLAARLKGARLGLAWLIAVPATMAVFMSVSTLGSYLIGMSMITSWD